MRWFLATIVFWLTLSVGSTRISFDEMPEMGLAETHKTFSDAWDARTRPGEVRTYYFEKAAPPHRLRVIRDEKEHVK